MLTFISLRLNSWRCIKMITRSHSTIPTIAQRMQCSQEFSFENYDCIGFDLDHTLCRYKLKPLFTLIYKTLASFLIEKYDYPKDLAEISEADFSFAQKGLVLDKRKGNFLKLDSQYRIVQASHGTRLLTNEDICKIYGPTRIWEESRGIPHKLVMNNALDEPFYVFKDYFVTAGAAICARLVDILDQRSGRSLEEYNFWDQYIEGILYMYERDNFKNNCGKFFPELKRNPKLYLRPCSKNVKQWLSEIGREKVVFLLTSANFDSAEFGAEFCLGPDWKKYFNIIITFARKPGFFWKNKSFYIVNDDSNIERVKPENMQSNFIYSQGNFKELQIVLGSMCKSKCPKILYFGDSLMEDVYAASELAGCDIVALVEEMLAEGMENVPDLHDERYVLLSDFWGSFFSYRTSDKNQEGSSSLWAFLLSQHSRLTVPNLDSISALGLQDKIPCFDGNYPSVSGFFPGVPKVLGSTGQPYRDQSTLCNRKLALHSGASSIM